jgi:hypothetical protein
MGVRARMSELRMSELLCRMDEAMRGADEAMRGADEAMRGADEVMRGADEAMRGADEAMRGADEVMRGEAMRGADEVMRGADEVMRGADEVMHAADEAMRGADEVMRGADEAAGACPDKSRATKPRAVRTKAGSSRANSKLFQSWSESADASPPRRATSVSLLDRHSNSGRGTKKRSVSGPDGLLRRCALSPVARQARRPCDNRSWVHRA